MGWGRWEEGARAKTSQQTITLIIAASCLKINPLHPSADSAAAAEENLPHKLNATPRAVPAYRRTAVSINMHRYAGEDRRRLTILTKLQVVPNLP